MFHHSDRDYAEAASAAAAKGRVKMEEIIQKGQASAEATVAIIQNHQPNDKIAPAKRIKLLPNHDGKNFGLATVELGVAGYRFGDEDVNPIHPHAFGQLLADVGLSKRDADRWMYEEAKGKEWGSELVADTVNTILSHREKQRNLIRIDGDNGDRVKGFLSDKFRRLDSRPLADAFMGLCVETGLVPIEGVASDTKCRIRAVLPKVFEPLDNEPMIFGLEFGNSDYGDGGVVVNLWNMRVWCTNTAVVQRGLRQIHLGGRLPDDLSFSAHTYKKDAETVASALQDVGQNLIGPEPINRMLQAVRTASETELRSSDGIDKLLKGLDKGEAQTVKQLFDSPDVVNLPPGDTVYRLANAVSFFAQNRGLDANRRLQLQEISGAMFGAETRKAREV